MDELPQRRLAEIARLLARAVLRIRCGELDNPTKEALSFPAR